MKKLLLSAATILIVSLLAGACPPAQPAKPECALITDKTPPLKKAQFPKRPANPLAAAPAGWAVEGTPKKDTDVADDTPANAVELAVAKNAQGVRIKVVHGDLVAEKVDAIVNAANGNLSHGAGVAAAIAKAAGSALTQESANYIKCHGKIEDGSTGLTGAGKLNPPVKYVPHTVGPSGTDTAANQDLLYAAYYNAFAKASEFGVNSLSIPSISTGIFGFPLKRASEIAFQAAFDFFAANPNSSIKELRFTNILSPQNDPIKSATPKQFLNEFRRLFNVA